MATKTKITNPIFKNRKQLLDKMHNDPDQQNPGNKWAPEEDQEITALIKEGFSTKVIVKYKKEWIFKDRSDQAVKVRTHHLRRSLTH